MSDVSAEKFEVARTSAAKELQQELANAYQLLRGCFEEMDDLLAQPVFNGSAWHLCAPELASLRLARGH